MGPVANNGTVRIGVLSDTHGTLTASARKALDGVDLIVHAGDVGSPEVIDALSRIAPVRAVRGNMDGGRWAADLPPVEVVEAGGATLYVLHDLYDLDLDPAAAGFDVVVHGHTHQASQQRREGVLYMNPGSASFPRRDAGPSAAVMEIRGREISVRFRRLS